MNKSNIHKKITIEDKFARKYYCQRARANQLKADKRAQKKQFRKFLTNAIIEEDFL